MRPSGAGRPIDCAQSHDDCREEDKPIEQERQEIVKDLQTPEEPVAATETVEAEPQQEDEKVRPLGDSVIL